MNEDGAELDDEILGEEVELGEGLEGLDDESVGGGLTRDDEHTTLVDMKNTSAVPKPVPAVPKKRKDERTDRTPIVSLRLSDETLARVRALVASLPALPAYDGWRITSHAVIRLAIAQGLNVLEAQMAQVTRAQKGIVK